MQPFLISENVEILIFLQRPEGFGFSKKLNLLFSCSIFIFAFKLS